MSSGTIVLGLLLGLAAPAGRGKPAADKPAAAPQPGPLQQVSELAKSAQARYETADFAGAIELWTQAYDLLPDAPEYIAQRSVLAFQIAQACVEAHAIDPKIAYLKKADVLFSGYLQSVDPQDTETVADIQGRLADIRAKIAEHDRLEAERLERERQDAAAKQAAAEAARQPDPAIERARQAELAARREAAERDAKKGKQLAIAGGVTLGLGASMLAVMAVGLGRGAKIDDQGDTAAAMQNPDADELQDLLGKGLVANRLAIAGGVLGGVLTVTGAALVGVGITKKRRAQKNLAFAPSWLPGGAGLLVTGRF